MFYDRKIFFISEYKKIKSNVQYNRFTQFSPNTLKKLNKHIYDQFYKL